MNGAVVFQRSHMVGVQSELFAIDSSNEDKCSIYIYTLNTAYTFEIWQGSVNSGLGVNVMKNSLCGPYVSM